MKYLLLLVAFFTGFATVFAQPNEGIKFSHYNQLDNGDYIISVKTSSSFIVGANRYVLHIGAHNFKRSLHPEGRLDEIQFILSEDEFQKIKKGAEMVLVYGYYHENTLQDGEGEQSSGFTGSHWRLGKFN